MKPLVTLAITTLNRTKYLPQVLASVLAQDYPNLDILVSDNGSIDATPVMTRELVNADPRVRFRRNDTTVPPHDHFTQCIRSARGEYFVLLNDDDRINLNFVSELVGVATRYPDMNAVVPWNVLIDEQGGTLRELAKPDREMYDGPTFVCDWLECKDPQFLCNPTTVLTRTEVIRRFGGYQSLRGNGRNIDNLLFLQCAITGRVGFACGATFYCRKHPESGGSRSTLQEIVESGRAYMRHLRRDPETVRALAALSSSRRKRILRGVAGMTTFELLNQMNLDQNAFRWRTVRTFLMSGRKDLMFFFIVFREYARRASPTMYYWLRGIVRPRSGEERGTPRIAS